VEALSRVDAGVHAVLLYGMDGSGKSDLAEALAQAWLCTHPEIRGCGECRACQSMMRKSNADVLRIAPGGAGNAIRLHFIADVPPPPDEPPVLSLQEFLRTMPLSSRAKVGMIFDADRLNPRAANALLKTLEEPQPYAKLILLTDSVGRILPTILSRCVAVACQLPTEDERDESLRDLTPLDWMFGEGAPGKAARVALERDIYEALNAFAQCLPSRQAGEALVAADEFRAIVERLEAKRSCGMRAAHTAALEALGLALERTGNARPDSIQLVAEAHRRVIGNGSASLALDSLFSGLLLERIP
jgi:DNA polymerase III subunit delta'